MAKSNVAPALKDLLVPIEDLHPDPANARVHDDRNLEAIRDSYERFGQQKPIVIASDGQVVAGNGQLAAAADLGWTHIAAVTTDLDSGAATAFAIADNQSGALAAWNDEQLATLIRQLQEEDATLLAATGFDDADLGALLEPPEPDPEMGAAPEPPDDPETQRGDLWVLGDHRLLCGDAGSSEDVDRLLGGESIHLVNTDPPYNVKVEPRSSTAIAAGITSFSRREDLQCERSTSERGKQDRERKRKRLEKQKKMHHQGFDVARGVSDPAKARKKMRAKDRPLENDYLSDEDFDQLLLAWFGQMARVLEPGRSFYIWGGYANLGNYPPALKACELYFSQAIVWDKQHPVLTRKDFMGAFEICFYGWRLGAGHEFFGPHNATDLWHVKKVNPQAMVHLTEKPADLALRAMHYSSRRGEHVLDLFGGSGSTLMAAEQVGRCAFLMEMDPAYCDVIVQRWQEYTGRKAERQPAEASA